MLNPCARSFTPDPISFAKSISLLFFLPKFSSSAWLTDFSLFYLANKKREKRRSYMEKEEKEKKILLREKKKTMENAKEF